MAAEAGSPSSGRVRADRLRPNNPERRTPMHNNENPKENWLSFPTVGMKGLPTALSQTPCNEDSI